MYKSLLTSLQFVMPILLILLILAQNKSGGLDSTFGGSGSFHASKRGPEKFLHNATIVVAILFFGVTVLSLYLS